MTITENVDVVDGALLVFREDRDAAYRAALEAVALLVKPLAGLISADRILREVAGDLYRFDATKHPPSELWSGEIVAKALISALPERLTPYRFVDDIAILAEITVNDAFGRPTNLMTISPEVDRLVAALLPEKKKGRK